LPFWRAMLYSVNNWTSLYRKLTKVSIGLL
jgi:hypothetical protein